MVSLEHLVDHYMRFPDGLPIQIRNPLSTKVNLTPKAPSPSQALIAKHKNKKAENKKAQPKIGAPAVFRFFFS